MALEQLNGLHGLLLPNLQDIIAKQQQSSKNNLDAIVQAASSLVAVGKQSPQHQLVSSNNTNSNAEVVSSEKKELSEMRKTMKEENERIRKRREQIAAASRKSRAKRKRELLDLRDENKKLKADVQVLEDRLRALGEPIPTEDSSNTSTKSSTGSDQHSDRSSVGSETEGYCCPNKSAEELKPIKTFMEARLQTYFNQLKEDMLSFNKDKLTSESSVELSKMTLTNFLK